MRKNTKKSYLHPEGYGFGWVAEQARTIAAWMAKQLGDRTLPPGPQTVDRVRRLAEQCPHINSGPQVNALVAGFEGRWPRSTGGSKGIQLCRSAGRQLATMKENLR